MALQKTNELDAIGVDNITGFVTLAIFDSLEWANEEEHLFLIQEKINAYLEFLESGEIYSVYEHAEGRNIEIKIYFKYDIPQNCMEFLEKAAEIVAVAGFRLNYKVG
ncbi:DUF6572 domain-containing protein [Paenibacillus sp. GCM10027627]|uniref:DUF6572 domain-containing protein n=1 Tax=unclassified Paenibacillus TaxID=185978 RepID=UPI00362CA993